MMQALHLIAPQSVDGSPVTSARYSGLAAAADAYLAQGITDKLADAGATVTRVIHPRGPGGTPDPDPIVNLGRFNADIAAAVADAIAVGASPLLLGGTCSHLIGMIAGFQRSFGIGTRIGLLWLDAHGDFNTPRTSYSGMLGGMPVAVTAGLCHAAWRDLAGQLAPIPTSQIVMIDVRNLDDREEMLIRATDVTIARFGTGFDPEPVIRAIGQLAARSDQIYLHVDADILDASLQPNHPTAEPGGPDLATTISVLGHAFDTGKICGFGVVSVNPTGADGPVSLANGVALVCEGARAWMERRARGV